ncbi:MAG: metallophosphoesterase family protein [Planctomycetota bacterium]
MLAVISDIHGNLEALTAVFAEIDRRGIQDVLCLGDVLGYGPDPLACLDMVRERCRATILGNHDFAVLFEPYNFNTGAESAAYWTRKQLEGETDKALRAERWRFLAALPARREFQQDGRRYQAVHASPRKPINEYVFPDDIYTNPGKFAALFERLGVPTLPPADGEEPAPATRTASATVCFLGHTHVPGVFTQQPDFYSPSEVEGRFTFAEGEKALVNVGSVGQPRDRDPRSSFAILSTTPERGPSVEFVRVEYDIQATKRKVEATGELDNFLGQRLLEGR